MLWSSGGLFLHRRYLADYSFSIPAKTRDWVDDNELGRDLLLQYALPRNQRPPLLVTSLPTGTLNAPLNNRVPQNEQGRPINQPDTLSFFDSVFHRTFLDTALTAHGFWIVHVQ